MIEVKRRANEPLDDTLKRFRRKVRKSGLMQELRRLSSYEKPSEKRRRRERLAEKRERDRQDGDDHRTSTPRQTR